MAPLAVIQARFFWQHVRTCKLLGVLVARSLFFRFFFFCFVSRHRLFVPFDRWCSTPPLPGLVQQDSHHEQAPLCRSPLARATTSKLMSLRDGDQLNLTPVLRALWRELCLLPLRRSQHMGAWEKASPLSWPPFFYTSGVLLCSSDSRSHFSLSW